MSTHISIMRKTRPAFTAGIHSCDPSSRGLLNLGLGESPYGMPEAAREILIAAAGGTMQYPDSSCYRLRKVLAEHYQIEPDMVFVGSGIDEIILAAAIAFVDSGDRVLLNSSTFSGFEAAAIAAGGQPIAAPLSGYNVNLNVLLSGLNKRPSLWFLCNPHNPTGTIVHRESVRSLIETAAQNGTVAVVDEAYAEYADPVTFKSFVPLINEYSNLIVLRTMSKIYGLAGLRCGYAIAIPGLIEKLNGIRGILPYGVNRLALATAEAAIRDTHFVSCCQQANDAVRRYVCSELRQLGLKPVSSSTNFVLVDLGQPAMRVCQQLLSKYGIVVRSAEGFGFHNHIRITMGTLEQMKGVVRSLREIILPELRVQETA